MEEIEAMKAIAEKMESLSEDERARVLNWAASKYSISLNTKSDGSKPPAFAAEPQLENAPSVGKPKALSASVAAKSRSSKKPKSIISMDKSLNLSPSGKISGSDFANSKAPANVMQKCVVAVYYLRDTIEMENVTVVAVLTFFKTLGWPVPADLKNTLQQAGTKGWLDTKDGDDIKLTSMGENLVEHALPPKAKV